MIRRSLVGGNNWRLRPTNEGVSLELRQGSLGAACDFTRNEAITLAAALVSNLQLEGESLDELLEKVRMTALRLRIQGGRPKP